jgi:hypothetical protein
MADKNLRPFRAHDSRMLDDLAGSRAHHDGAIHKLMHGRLIDVAG